MMTKIKELVHSRKFIIWFPAIFFTVIGVVMYIIRVCRVGFEWLKVLEFAACIAVCYVFPVGGIVFKRNFTPALTWCAGYLVTCGVFIERAFGIYQLWDYYDKFLHTGFGLVGAAIIYILMIRFKSDKQTTAGTVLFIMLATLGLGAAWEIFEYAGDFLSVDPQRWFDVVYNSIDATWAERLAAMQAGEDWSGIYIIVGHAMKDTIEDMIVTVIGSGVFCMAYIANLHIGDGKTFRKFFGDEWVNDAKTMPDYITARKEASLDELTSNSD